MASSSRTKFLLSSSSSSSSPLFIFIFCLTMHACISSDARDIRPVDDAKPLQDSEQPFTSASSSASPCRRIIRAEFGSRTRSGREVAVAVYSSSSSLDHVDHKTVQNEVSGGGSRSQARSENSDMINDHQDIAVMDYHPPHRNSPIHNR